MGPGAPAEDLLRVLHHALASLLLSWLRSTYEVGGAYESRFSLKEETQQPTRDGLESRGWYDDPTDSIDALYSPGCGAVGEMGGEA